VSVCGTVACSFPSGAFLGPKDQPDRLGSSPRLPHSSDPLTGVLRVWRRHLQRHPRPTPQRPPVGLDRLQAVTEYKPFVHRLRHKALGLGPTNPTWTHLPSETLGIRWARFSRASCYSYRHSHSHSLHRPSRDDFNARATLPYHPLGSAASVTSFSPGTLSARDHSTSELLRTLSMVAASKPTSWLSGQSHILLHLARTWGP
jgi:hypothetical protein